MLIRGAELESGRIADVRIAGGRIAAIGPLTAEPGEPVLEARGGLLLPGLHDHHIHLAAFAAALNSVRCGPPEVQTADELAAALRAPGTGWLRGTGYHESVAGLPDAAALDRIVADRPVRIQHRGGRMWFLNSAALDRLLGDGAARPPGLEMANGRPTGRLFDEDGWLRGRLGGTWPCFAAAGARLARAGVTGLTDMTPANGLEAARHFAAETAAGTLPQRVLLAGTPALAGAPSEARVTIGPVKLHLHEAALPALDDTVARVAAAHEQGRAVAVHCATEVELVYALAAIAEAGAVAGDRIEHASVAPDHAVARIAALGLAVVTQPHFIAERGDAYAREVEPAQQPWLYRLRAFLDAGVPLAGGSDAPFGGADPWAAMRAATTRRTADGRQLGAAEALTPEEALELFLRAPDALGERRRVEAGAPADLCLLDRPWREARALLSSALVRLTMVAGRIVHDRVDQAPAQPDPGRHAAA